MQKNKQSLNLNPEFWAKFNIISKEINTNFNLFKNEPSKCRYHMLKHFAGTYFRLTKHLYFAIGGEFQAYFPTILLLGLLV